MRHDEAIDQGQNENKMGKRNKKLCPIEDEIQGEGDGKKEIEFFAPLHDRKAGFYLSIIYINNIES